MSLKKIMLITAAMIAMTSNCMAHSYINFDKIFKKLEEKEQKPQKCFRNTISIGPNIGYSFTETYTNDKSVEDVAKNMGLKRFQSNNHSIGFHADYNHFVTDDVFVGVGYSMTYLPPSKEFKLFSTSTKFYPRSGDFNYKNQSVLLISKKNSQYFTLRAGTLLCDYITVDVNVSMAVSEFNVKGALFTHTFIKSLGETLNFNDLKNDTERTRSYGKVGVAPGLGMNISLNKNFSLGLNYMCEIYPKNHDGSKPKMITHNIFTKFSYHI